MAEPTSPKNESFKIDKLKNEVEELKITIQHLEEENAHLQEQMETGGKRRGQIKKVEAMMAECQKQIEDTRIENERLEQELDALVTERDDGFRRRDQRIAELEARLNELGSSQDGVTKQLQQELEAAQQAAERLREELSKTLAQLEIMRNEKAKLKERLLKAKQEVSQLQVQLNVPSLDGSMSPGGSPSKTVKQLEERIRQLEASLNQKNKYILNDLRR
eukprot:TRINITY_DN4163_c0_g1_i4.p1 TRINITY_DN4163_c0_g1~~TRINITY_DN4163_c0_g1_i4.p1  ORF type:complete len:219 (+),score=94.03 TRINITY_DN4163_c0_g1_i4:209-865(+)